MSALRQYSVVAQREEFPAQEGCTPATAPLLAGTGLPYDFRRHLLAEHVESIANDTVVRTVTQHGRRVSVRVLMMAAARSGCCGCPALAS
jgi:hypothetical protein